MKADDLSFIQEEEEEEEEEEGLRGEIERNQSADPNGDGYYLIGG